jgi:beta-N-acetylglucosaminidase
MQPMAVNKSREYARVHRYATEAANAAIVGMKDVGAVGYGYVTVSPGNSGFARWLRKYAGGSSQTGLWRGTHIAAHTGQQAYATNYEWARVYAATVKGLLPGITAFGLCRAD